MACLLAWAQQTALSIGGDYVQKGVQKGVNIVINQFRYMCCLKQFEQELNGEEHALSVVQQEVHRIVQKESKDTKVPDEPVADWITRTDNAMDEVHRLQNAIGEDKRCFGNWCPNLLWRRTISKQAQELSATLKNLKEERSGFKTLTRDPDLPNIEFIGSMDFIPSKASKLALADIIKALQIDDVNTIGLHGMPGVGKTTLAKQVKNEAEKLRLFDEYIFVTVTEKPEFNAIQYRIAEQLQVKFGDQDSWQQRASKLMLRLQDEKKKLLVLDDVWQEINLHQIGIPYVDDLKKCKILLTTRRIPVCEAMNCQRKILLDILTEDEAWALFKSHAHLEDDSSLIDVAKKVAKECGRLPIAIKSVGKCLKGKSRQGWERALKKLQEGEHLELRDMNKEENAYRSIKFSFDELQREPTKRCLLLCCLLPEDYDVCVENLFRYAHGLGLYHSSSDQSTGYTVREVMEAVDELKDNHLLLEGEREGYVKMHDLIRDVVLLIASKVEEFKVATLHRWPTDGRYRDYAAISLHDWMQWDNRTSQLPDQLDAMDYPKLKLLLLGNMETDYDWNPHDPLHRLADIITGFPVPTITVVPDRFFQGMEKLEVLSISCGKLSINSLEFLTNIRTLELRYCSFTSGDNYASLGNLKRLEILSFYGSEIEKLPDKIGELKNLKLLQLTRCFGIKIIPSNMIRNLSKMEELHFGDFSNWEEFTGRSNASLMELNSLPNLTFLSLKYPEDTPENFCFSGKLTGYYLQLGAIFGPKSVPMLRYPTSRVIGLKATQVNVNACKKLFGSVYTLAIAGSTESFKNMIPDMSQNGFQHLFHLVVVDCNLESIISTNQQQVATADSFTKLENLEIYNTSLEQICEGWPTEGFLKRLRTLRICGCNPMIIIFPAKLMPRMRKLESVTVESCENLHDVFQMDDGIDEANNDCLSKLTSLELRWLWALKCIWNGRSIHLVNLKCLTHFTVYDCRRLASLFPVSIAQTLEHLETLVVEYCDDLEHIIAEKEEDSISKAQQQNLSEVGYMFSKNQVMILPSFRHVVVRHCPKLLMHSLVRLSLKLLPCTESVTIPLEVVDLDGCSQLEHIISKENINTHFPPVCFTYLRVISIRDCKKLKILLPISTISSRSLPQLERLVISRCDELVQVFELGNEADKIEEEIQFPKLFELALEGLPSLVRFCPQGYHFVFPSLLVFQVKECPKMITSFVAAPNSTVYTKSEASMRGKDAATESAVTLHSPNEDSKWRCFNGEWKEDAFSY